MVANLRERRDNCRAACDQTSREQLTSNNNSTIPSPQLSTVKSLHNNHLNIMNIKHNDNNNNPQSIKPKHIPPQSRHKKPMQSGSPGSLTLVVCATFLVCVTSLLGEGANNATANNNPIASTTPTSANQKQVISNTSSAASPTSSNKTALPESLAASQQQLADSADSSDLNSMYVQIPVAEPLDGPSSDNASNNKDNPEISQQQHRQQEQQQMLDGGDSAGGEGNSRWNGPWARKFQIGYIKQSDLHQVLMESLKQEPFTSLTGSNESNHTKLASKTSAPAAPPSDNSSLMSPVKSPARQSSPIHSSPNSGTRLYGTPPTSQSQPQLVPVARGQHPMISGINPAAMFERPGPFPKGPTNPAYGPNQLVPDRHQQQKQHQFQQQPFSFNRQLTVHAHMNNQHQMPFHNQQFNTNTNNFRLNPFRPQQQQNHQFSGNNNPFRPPQQNQNQNGGNQMPLYGMPLGPAGPLPPPQPQVPVMQQFQFGQGSFKNQPIYTTITQQQQPLAELSNNNFAPETPSIPRPLNSAGKAASNLMDVMGMNSNSNSIPGSNRWNPVMTQQTQGNNQNELADFDDGFNPPSPSSSLGGGNQQQQATKSSLANGSVQQQQQSVSSMNRHPALNSYLQQTRASPTMIYRNQTGTQSASPSSSSSRGKSARGAKGFVPQMKISSDPPSGAKGGVSPTNNRKTPTNSNSNSTTTTTTQRNLGSDEQQTTTTPASTSNATSTTMSSAMITTESETQDPESETVDTTDSDDAPDASSTTTASSGNSSEQSTSTATPSLLAAGAGQAKSDASSPIASSSSTTTDSSIDSEVATQASGAGSATSSSTTAPTSTSGPDQAAPTSASSVDASQREETTPASSTPRGLEMESGKATGAPSDEALMANAIRAQIDKSNNKNNAATITGPNQSQKRVRSSERLQKQQSIQSQSQSESEAKASQTSKAKLANLASPANRIKSSKSQQQQASSTTKSTKSAAASKSREFGPKGGRGNSNPSTRSAKSARVVASPSSSTTSTSTTTSTTRSPKLSRMAGEQPIAQVVRMTDAQALSTAQTLASILMSRCMMSTNCAHLLDVCSTKQASFSLPTQEQIQPTTNNPASSANDPTGLVRAANWSLPVGLGSSQLISLAQSLQADRVLRLFPLWRETIETTMDSQDSAAGSTTGYSLLLPSNEAVDQLSSEQVQAWNANSELLAQIIDNHILEFPETFELNGSSLSSRAPRSRYVRSKSLQVNQYRDRMITLNGKRLIYANQLAPAGGRVHVIDGILDWQSLWTAGQLSRRNTNGNANGNTPADPTSTPNPSNPNNGLFASTQMPDILDTLKRCDKFDGFVTLVEGTGLAQILKQDGPLTVFVPSNEALRRIPDEELEVIKNNSTALKEFLMYHVANGSYFSQDLRDGQQINSILNSKPIQVGVRVDGCTRRLVEANTSPMRRADISAKNGVIHILDWYLTAQDNDWCDPLTFSTSSRNGAAAASESSSTPNVSSFSGNSLAESGSAPIGMQVHQDPSSSPSIHQQARHSSASLWNQDYATRLSMPANHKLEQHVTQATNADTLTLGGNTPPSYLDEQQVAINEQLQQQEAINRIGLLGANQNSNSTATETISSELTNALAINDLARQTAPSDSLSRRA